MPIRIAAVVIILLRATQRVLKEIPKIRYGRKELPGSEATSECQSDNRDALIRDVLKEYGIEIIALEIFSALTEIAFMLSDLFSVAERIAGGNPYLTIIFSYAFLYCVVRIPANLGLSLVVQYMKKKGLFSGWNSCRHLIKNLLSDLEFEGILCFLTLLLNRFYTGARQLTISKTGNGANDVIISVFQTPMNAYTWWLIVLIIPVAILVALFVVERSSYHCKPLPEGSLRDKIMYIQNWGWKKFTRISIADSSEDMLTDEAFILHFLWYRELAIPKRMLREFPEDEIVASVIQKTAYSYRRKRAIWFILGGVLFMVMTALISAETKAPYNGMLSRFDAWLRYYFSLKNATAFVWFHVVYETLADPVRWLVRCLSARYRRDDVYESDRFTVLFGYGESMIRFLKRSSTLSDALVPLRIIDIIEGKRPISFLRTDAIRKLMEQRTLIGPNIVDQ